MTRLPDFIIGGAQKSGTTSLEEKLSRHPDVYIPQGMTVGGTTIRDELHFFDSEEEYDSEVSGHWEKGIEWYKRQFSGGSGEDVAGERTATYLHNKNAAGRIKQVVPDVKLIFILRDPRKRAYSQYWMHRRNSGDTTPFADLVLEDRGSMLTSGHYAEQLKIYLDNFRRSQIKLFTLKELKDNPIEVYQEAYKFIGVDPSFVPPNPHKAHYKGGAPRSHRMAKIRQVFQERNIPLVPNLINLFNIKGQLFQILFHREKRGYPPIGKEIKKKLTDHYRPHNEELKLLFPSLQIEHWNEV